MASDRARDYLLNLKLPIELVFLRCASGDVGFVSDHARVSMAFEIPT
jgi:hypothetical protein